MIEQDTLFNLTHRLSCGDVNHEGALYDLRRAALDTAEALAMMLAHAMDTDEHRVPAWMVEQTGNAISSMGRLAHQADSQQRQLAEHRRQAKQGG
ncbi:MAG: hypothetical protein KDI27_03480 [Gammaproteobacteria bacterium]|nr:hypothetical protein [Gammaproteobacteria bacterium]MCP5416462.1 hypothetical protein [Chromatiaceae bacterium]